MARKSARWASSPEFVPSQQQAEILRFIREGEENGVIEARAGTGKTSTIVRAAAEIPPTLRTGIVCYNNHIAKHAGDQLRRAELTHVSAMTIHSLGFQAVRSAFPNLRQPDQFKLSSIVRGHTSDPKTATALRSLVVQCKNCLLDGTDPGGLSELARHHNIELPGRNWQAILAMVPRILLECLDSRSAIDFDDMLWFPVKLGLRLPQYDVLLVDEAQDLNPAQQALIYKACEKGRIIAVGDEYQSIYGFRGADVNAINSMRSALKSSSRGCRTLPLTVTRRCPVSHVDLAASLVSDIEPMEDAPHGEVLELSKEEAVRRMAPGSLVMCRDNRGLIGPAYALLRRGVKVLIRGRDFGRDLIALIDRLKASDIPDLHERLIEYQRTERARLVRLQEMGSSLLDELNDRVACVIELCEGLSSIAELRKQIQDLFADSDPDSDTHDFVVLGTIHRSKGLESNDVFILSPELLPHPRARQEWEIQQEFNCAYIAATRAKFERGRHPGRLIFVGKTPELYGWCSRRKTVA